jgi:hypothetical protein
MRVGEKGHHFKNGEGIGKPIQKIVGVATTNLQTVAIPKGLRAESRPQ